jgi:asparagine synthase (glutamine-hydrolysing)
MCGIAGIFAKSGLTPDDQQALNRMSNALVHRGPDGDGFYIDGFIGLAHRRLSIIDLEGGKQPLANENGTVWVALNGEIYNYIELREQLFQKGHRFATSSDTEVIVHLYEDKGEDFVSYLRGMFAIALWDANTRRLLLVRDRLGKKPIFYGFAEDKLVFASEMKALLQVSTMSRDVDYQALVDYFSLRYIPSPKSIFRAIRKVRPGHYLVIDSKGCREREYWDISFDELEERSEAEWCEELLRALQEAVRLRLRSDVPLGAFLSGGVDSSSIVALISRMNKGRVSTCSVGFDEKDYDESIHAAEFARLLKTQHHEEMVRPDALFVLDKLSAIYDEPFGDWSAVPTYYVSQAARRHVTVALSGDGGDENFAGYRRYHLDVMQNRFRSYFPATVRKRVFDALGTWYPRLAWAPPIFRAQATFQALSRCPVEGYFYSVSAIRPEVKNLLLTGDVHQTMKGYNSANLFHDFYDHPERADHLSRLQYLDMKTYLVDDILVKIDRASMANSLEVRSPLLDHKFVELAAHIPSSLKLKAGQSKYIFKKAVSQLLPIEVLNRRKQGFAVPMAGWLRGQLRDFSGDLMLSEDPLGFLDRKAVGVLWTDHQAGRYNYSAELWAILMYRLWQKMFLAGAERKTEKIKSNGVRSFGRRQKGEGKL